MPPQGFFIKPSSPICEEHKSTSEEAPGITSSIDPPFHRSISLPSISGSLITLPTRIRSILCLPLSQRSDSTSSPTSSISDRTTSTSRTPNSTPYLSHPLLPPVLPQQLTRHSPSSTYHSFPTPTFKTGGQPRALDTRTYPELLADISPPNPASNAPSPTSERGYWRSRPHLWAEVVASRRQLAPLSPAESKDAVFAPLTLRGGAIPNLKDTDLVPSHMWYLSGGRGPPPTVMSLKAWRKRDRDGVLEAHKGTAREGQAKRGFWAESAWGLWGWRLDNSERRKKRNEAVAAAGGGDGGTADGGGGADTGAAEGG